MFSGKYAYIDASGVVGGSKAVLLTGSFTMRTHGCLTFWYHMFGENVGSLTVSEHTDATSREAWKLTGDKTGKT